MHDGSDEEFIASCYREMFALFMPNVEDDVPYTKALLECCVNILVKCLQSRSRPQGINEEMIIQMQQIGRTLGYMINSTSWQRGTYENFDKFEIGKRLEFAANISNVNKE